MAPIDPSKSHGEPTLQPLADWGVGSSKSKPNSHPTDRFAEVTPAAPLAAELVPGDSVPIELFNAEWSTGGSDSLIPTLTAVSSTLKPTEDLSDEDIERSRHWRRILLGTVPSWLISLVLHLILLVTLALITFDPVQQVLSILESSGDAEEAAVDEFTLDGPEESETPTEAEESVTLPAATTAPQLELAEVQPPSVSTVQPTLTGSEVDALSNTLLDRSLLAGSVSSMATSLNSRSSSSKSEMLEKFGGNAASEKSVALALKWFATHQIRSGPKSGAWSFNHNIATRKPSTGQGDFSESTNAATALALLPFLGAGQTHIEGQYKETVKDGLAALIRNMQLRNEDGLPCGSWHEPRGNMYSHGLATIAVCEAYAMTNDPDLLQPAQLALNYIVACQDPRGGGWRYRKGERGDTSVVGWCLMGLKSGRMGNLAIPTNTFARTNGFLDLVSTDNGAFYGYTGPDAKRNLSMTSVGLLCRMYSGWPKEHEGIQTGTKFLSSAGPRLDNLYYTYYATQVLRHYGGQAWEQWNKRLRDPLVALQITEGTDAGSWEPKGSHSRQGGRLYQTSLATMILEVYYRHLPLYSDKSLADDFEI